jgi:DMSO/TMAO reductase YedYZ molybdopterin-dependent catalytic subunit
MGEVEYDRGRLAQFLAGEARADGLSRRGLMRLSAGVGLGVAAGAAIGGAPAQAADPPILKPLPPELFTVFGTNAETRWEALRETGYLVPVDRFFVRNHTLTPRIDADAWRLRVSGSGLRGGPVEFGYRELRHLPADTITAAVECAGNGRGFFASQQGQAVSGTGWKLGAVGVARWKGVRLSTVLKRAGLSRAAVDVQPVGLDPHFVSGGVDLGPVRRPLPVDKALHDVLLAYEMNGEPLPPDHGFPLRVVVPNWIGVASIKWLGRLEVSAEPLFSPWNTQFYRLFGPTHPTDGDLVGRQTVKSAFELPWEGRLPAGRQVLRGRSWSGNGRIRRVEVSTDGRSWRPARLVGPGPGTAWQRWEYPWHPAPGSYALRARATDETGVTQPETVPHNTLGYLFGAIVRHPVTVA